MELHYVHCKNLVQLGADARNTCPIYGMEETLVFVKVWEMQRLQKSNLERFYCIMLMNSLYKNNIHINNNNNNNIKQ